jgi:hypothetical protein
MSGDSTRAIGRASLFVWQVSADQEEPSRRFLQELSGSRFEEYAKSRRRLGIFAESVWFAPKPSGGGAAVVFLEAEDSERALRELVAELAASETLSTLGLGGGCTSSSVAISHSCRAQQEASSFSLGGRRRSRRRRSHRRWRGPKPTLSKAGLVKQKEKVRSEGEV